MGGMAHDMLGCKHSGVEETPMKLPGPMELVIILGIVLLIFGAGRLPEIGSALGKGISAFKRGVTGENKPEEEPVEASEKTELPK